MRLWIDESEIRRLSRGLAAVGKRAPVGIARALNHTGAKATTRVKRVLVAQTGATARGVSSALRSPKKASAGSLEYRLPAKSGYLSLKYFGARQTKKGVSAAPWNDRRIFPHTFGPGIGKLGGHVYRRVGKSRFPIEKLWGPSIAAEMVKGESEAAWKATVDAELLPRIEHELGAMLAGFAR